MKQIYIKNRLRRQDEFQFFMHQFVESCIRNGFLSVKDIIPSYRFFVRSVLRRFLLCLYRMCRVTHMKLFSKKKALLITANGVTIQDNIFPYYFNYEVVPMLWDVWPSTWERMYNSFKLFDIRMVFVTSSQVAEHINSKTNIHAYWIPEGIDKNGYKNEKRLVDRQINILEMGRQHPKLHSVLVQMVEKKLLFNVASSKINADGTLNPNRLSFNSFEDLSNALSNAKILICFPQCDTNPNRAGNIETLTQRYWEGMLSGCVLLGRAPKELIQLIGYNPVIDVDWNNVDNQILEILEHIDTYQVLVDKNYDSAQNFASWDNRIILIKEYLKKEQYCI